MQNLRQTIQHLINPVKPLPPGMYHYQAPPADPRNYRLHLRLENDGRGVLILNASTVLHLNQTAAEYAFYLVQNMPPEKAAYNVAQRYRVSQEQALQDYQDFQAQLETLIDTPDLDPVTFLGFDRSEPFSGSLSAPYRLDCALTYRLPEGVEGSAAPSSRVSRELDTNEWKGIIDKAWGAGIPHIIFTGGEPTLRDDLPELIAHTERNNLVSGLLTDGHRLVEANYLNLLLMTGLDHLTLIFSPDNALTWQALDQVIAADIFAVVHLTLTPENQADIQALLEKLAERGVGSVSLSTSDPALEGALQAARDKTAALNMELVWNIPVPYSRLNPIQLEVEVGSLREDAALPEGAGKAIMYVEPDGDVLPAQGINRVLGNLQREPFETIWKNKPTG
jgi:hypothetical protein